MCVCVCGCVLGSPKEPSYHEMTSNGTFGRSDDAGRGLGFVGLNHRHLIRNVVPLFPYFSEVGGEIPCCVRTGKRDQGGCDGGCGGGALCSVDGY